MNQQPFEPSEITFASESRESYEVFHWKSPFCEILALISVMTHESPRPPSHTKFSTFPSECIFQANFVCQGGHLRIFQQANLNLKIVRNFIMHYHAK